MGAASLRLRDARASDLDAIDRLEGASFSAVDRFPRRTLSRAIRNETASVIVAELNESIAGYVLLLFRKGATAARLYSLAIAPGARGQGTARALVDAAATKALDRGCARLRLEVRQSNLAARRLYERAGFMLIATKPGYYEDGETALQMEMRLDTRERTDR
ncbi:MAG: GNAT family N-acetyltransferase [Amphiplicatus sp.]